MQHAILVSSEVAHSPTHHILPRSAFHIRSSPPPGSPTTESCSPSSCSPAPTSTNLSDFSQRSSPAPTVTFRSPSQIIYTSSNNPAYSTKRINPKDYYDSLPYPPDAYQVPITIPTSQVGQILYHVPKSSLSSEKSRTEGFSDTLSECSDSSTSAKRSINRDPMQPIHERIGLSDLEKESCMEEKQALLFHTLPYHRTANKKQLYGFGGKKRDEPPASLKASVIRPATTKKREITSAFSPLLASQKESEV